jgi:hypothetical protein
MMASDELKSLITMFYKKEDAPKPISHGEEEKEPLSQDD